MIHVKLNVEMATLPNMQKALQGFEEEIPVAVAQSITFTAERVQSDLQNSMRMSLHNPRPYTINSVYRTSASPARLYAQVGLKDQIATGTPAAKYLQPQIEGGARDRKGVEAALEALGLMPAGTRLAPGRSAPLDQYGNVPRGQVKKALADIKNGRRARGRGEKRPRGKQYFWLPGEGIFWRTSADEISGLLTTAENPQYDQRFDFYGVSERSVAHHLPAQVEKSIERALKRAGAGAGTPG